jgi:GT2 family glycosyltransferase
MPTLSVVIPATDEPATLPRVIAAIRRAEAPPEELIVVDRPIGSGPAAARNAGAHRASGDVLVFVDADVEVHGDVFVRMRAAFDHTATLAGIFGSYDDDPGADGVVSAFRNLLHHHVHHEGAGPATTFWAGLGAIRRETFFAVGGFDEERYPVPSVEDIELGMRIHARGEKVVLDPTIQGTHLKPWTLSKMTSTDLFQRGVPWLRLLLEEKSTSRPLNLGRRHIIASAASLILLAAALRRKPRAAASMLALLIVLDRRFYLLLLRRRGPVVAATGVLLHIAHRLTSAAAVPLAVTHHLRERLEREGRS